MHYLQRRSDNQNLCNSGRMLYYIEEIQRGFRFPISGVKLHASAMKIQAFRYLIPKRPKNASEIEENKNALG